MKKVFKFVICLIISVSVFGALTVPVHAEVGMSDYILIRQASTPEQKRALIRQVVDREVRSGSVASIEFLDLAIGFGIAESDASHSHSLISTMSLEVANRALPDALPLIDYYKVLRDLVEISIAAQSIEKGMAIRPEFLWVHPKPPPSPASISALKDIGNAEGVQLNIPLLPILFEITHTDELKTGTSRFVVRCDRQTGNSFGRIMDGPAPLLNLSAGRVEEIAETVCAELTKDQFGISVQMPNNIALAALVAAPAALGVREFPDDHDLAQRLRLLIALVFTELQKRGELGDSKLGDVAPAMLFDLMQDDIPNRPGLRQLDLAPSIITHLRRKIPAAFFFSGNNLYLLERYEELMGGAGDISLWIGAMNGALISGKLEAAAKYGCLVATAINSNEHLQLWWMLESVTKAHPQLFEGQSQSCVVAIKSGIEAFNQSDFRQNCSKYPLLCLPAYNDISLVLSLMARFDPSFLSPLIQFHQEPIASARAQNDGHSLGLSGYMGLLTSDLRIIKNSISWQKNDFGSWVRRDASDEATAFDFVEASLNSHQAGVVKYSSWRVGEDAAETAARYVEGHEGRDAIQNLRDEVDIALAAGRPQLFIKLWIFERLELPLFEHRLTGSSWNEYTHSVTPGYFVKNEAFLRLLSNSENTHLLGLWNAAQEIDAFLTKAFPE